MLDWLLTQVDIPHLFQWAEGLGAGLATYFGLVLLHLVVAQRLGPYRRPPRARRALWAEALAAMLRRASTPFRLAVATWVGTLFVDLPARLEAFLGHALVVVVALQLGLWGTGLVDVLVDAAVDRLHAGRNGALRTARGLLRTAGLGLVWTAVTLLICDNVGLQISTLLAGVSILGLAIGLATQKILSDLFASVALLMDQAFEVGDFIAVDGIMGTVRSMGLRSTRLLSMSGEEIVLPNSSLTATRIHNYRSLAERRVQFVFSVRNATSVDRLEAVPELAQAAINEVECTRFARAHLSSLGDSAAKFEVLYYIDSSDYDVYMATHQAVLLGLMGQLAAAGIALAQSPEQDVTLERTSPAESCFLGGREAAIQ